MAEKANPPTTTKEGVTAMMKDRIRWRLARCREAIAIRIAPWLDAERKAWKRWCEEAERPQEGAVQ